MQGAARGIVLVDADKERAQGQALDLSHGAFFTPPVEILAGDYEDCSGADVVVLCAGAKQKPGQSRMDLLGQNVEICKAVVEKVVPHASDAVLLVVANPVDVLTYAALRFSGLPRERVIGSGTVLDSARFRYLLSRHCRVDPRNVHGYVLGEHGDSEVVAWSITRIGGMQMDDCCRTCVRRCSDAHRDSIAEEVRNSAYHVIEAKGSTNFAVGLALVRIVTSILRSENSVLTVSTLMEGEYGIHDVCLSLPAILNRNGVERVLSPPLADEEVQALRSSAEAIRLAQEQVGLS
jgi:L-lactate dehydrogenase